MKRTILLFAWLPLFACQVDDGAEFRIAPVCIEADDAPADAWQCSEPLTIDCNDASVTRRDLRARRRRPV